MPKPRKLRVFLCHASQDKPVVRELYQRLLAEGWIDPWLDEEKLLPGQDWDLEIEKAVESTDIVIVCLSKKSVSKEGYVQREIKFALDIALEKPEESIYIIPLRLDDVQTPRRMKYWQYVDYFPPREIEANFDRLLKSLRIRAKDRKIKLSLRGSVSGIDNRVEKNKLDHENKNNTAIIDTEEKNKQIFLDEHSSVKTRDLKDPNWFANVQAGLLTLFNSMRDKRQPVFRNLQSFTSFLSWTFSKILKPLFSFHIFITILIMIPFPAGLISAVSQVHKWETVINFSMVILYLLFYNLILGHIPVFGAIYFDKFSMIEIDSRLRSIGVNTGLGYGVKPSIQDEIFNVFNFITNGKYNFPDFGLYLLKLQFTIPQLLQFWGKFFVYYSNTFVVLILIIVLINWFHKKTSKSVY